MSKEKIMGDVVLFTSNTCPSCTHVVEYLTSKGIKFTQKSLNDPIDGAKTRIYLMRKDVLFVPYLEIMDKDDNTKVFISLKSITTETLTEIFG